MPQPIIIAAVNQKGGGGRSTIIRAVAVEFAKAKWPLLLADMDYSQFTSRDWHDRRQQLKKELEQKGKHDRKKLLVDIEVEAFKKAIDAVKAAKDKRLLLFDGAPAANTDTRELANLSDIVLIPTGVSTDDLKPSLRLAKDLVNATSLDASQILFIINKVPPCGDKNVILAKSSITHWGYKAATPWLDFKVSYSDAMDDGCAVTETRYDSLNRRAGRIVEEIAAMEAFA